ncbi:MarR family transcriptional regulator, partial [Mesorhizobium sp. M7A.F.Ca.US.006.01.2.1]
MAIKSEASDAPEILNLENFLPYRLY